MQICVHFYKFWIRYNLKRNRTEKREKRKTRQIIKESRRRKTIRRKEKKIKKR
jgi:hypothetical protein